MLDTVRSVRGNQTAYLELVARGEHILNVLPDALEPWISPEQEAATAAAAAAAVPPANERSGFVVESLPADAPL